MKFFYIIITAAFAHAMQNRESTVNTGHYFGYAVTIDSTYVASVNSVNDFPGAFDSLSTQMPDSTLQVVVLGSSDFPPSPPIK